VPDDLVKRLRKDLQSPKATAHYQDMKTATEEEIRVEITARLEQLKEKLKRCEQVRYRVIIRDGAGHEIDTEKFETKSPDIWLGLKPHWLK
jgi:hypothetical protein